MSQALQVSRPYPLLKLLLDPHTLVKVKPAINSQVQVIVKVLLALRTHPSGVRLPFTAQGPHALSAAVSAVGRAPTLSRLPSRPPPTRRMPPVPNRRRFAPLPHVRSLAPPSTPSTTPPLIAPAYQTASNTFKSPSSSRCGLLKLGHFFIYCTVAHVLLLSTVNAF
ncbi:hypothetical protein C8J57DRAFT_1584929 [Mycena rebaudengoi]|nr:hypothetical protein C8J57DRAFT_1584929 [Mycena rebaudengoi]